MKPISSARAAYQRGFTLIEMLIVAVIIGVFLIMFAPGLAGGTDNSKAKGLQKTAQTIASNLSILSQTAGISSAISGNVLPAAGSTMADVLFVGSSKVAAAYQGAYSQAKIVPLNQTVVSTGSSYTLFTYPITLGGGGASPVTVTYTGVPDTIALLTAQSYNPGATIATLASAGNAGPVSWSADTSNLVNITYTLNL
jgi:prepilin-type N-terminal cleavage/methylation domain-containing protein